MPGTGVPSHPTPFYACEGAAPDEPCNLMAGQAFHHGSCSDPVANAFLTPGQVADMNYELFVPNSARSFLLETFVRGDCNGDGRTDLADALTLMKALWTDNVQVLACQDACDVDDDGRVDEADRDALLDWLFLGGAAPAAPVRSPDRDRTFDALTCWDPATAP